MKSSSQNLITVECEQAFWSLFFAAQRLLSQFTRFSSQSSSTLNNLKTIHNFHPNIDLFWNRHWRRFLIVFLLLVVSSRTALFCLSSIFCAALLGHASQFVSLRFRSLLWIVQVFHVTNLARNQSSSHYQSILDGSNKLRNSSMKYWNLIWFSPNNYTRKYQNKYFSKVHRPEWFKLSAIVSKPFFYFKSRRWI